MAAAAAESLREDPSDAVAGTTSAGEELCRGTGFSGRKKDLRRGPAPPLLMPGIVDKRFAAAFGDGEAADNEFSHTLLVGVDAVSRGGTTQVCVFRLVEPCEPGRRCFVGQVSSIPTACCQVIVRPFAANFLELVLRPRSIPGKPRCLPNELDELGEISNELPWLKGLRVSPLVLGRLLD